MYEPRLARFLSRDPLPENGVELLYPFPETTGFVAGGTTRGHGYAYARNNPMSFIDPAGLDAVVADAVFADPFVAQQPKPKKANPCDACPSCCCGCLLYGESRGTQGCYTAIVCVMSNRQKLANDPKWPFRGETGFCEQAEMPRRFAGGLGNKAYENCCCWTFPNRIEENAANNAIMACDQGCTSDPTGGAQYWFADEGTARRVILDKNIPNPCQIIKVPGCSQVFVKCSKQPLR